MVSPDKKRVANAVFQAVAELNAQLPKDARLAAEPNTSIAPGASGLSSLHLVVLIVATEQKLEEEFGVSIPIAKDDVLSQAESPFQTLGSLIEFAYATARECIDG